MKYTMKVTAALMAAAMSFSVIGAASAGAVDFNVINGGSSSGGPSNSTPSFTPSNSTPNNSSGGAANSSSSGAVVQNAVPEFFNGCVKFTWTAVTGAGNYAVKICNTDGTIVNTYYISNKYNAVIVPETVFGVDYNSEKEFYACVITLKKGESDNPSTVFYAPSASKFTVKSDMSEYPDYGAAQNVTFMVKDGKLLIGWKNPNDFAETKDIFNVSISDRSGKNVFSKSTTACNIEASGLKDGETYTVKINNKTFSAMSVSEYKFVSDASAKKPEQSSSEKSPQKDTSKKLPAPLGLKVKSGDSKLTLSWNSVDEAYAYRVYMYDAKTKKYKRYKTVKNTKCTVSGLSNGKSYKFKIVALRYDSSTKKYTPGKYTKAVSGTPKKTQKSKK